MSFPSFPGRRMNRTNQPNIHINDIMKLPLPTIIGIIITVLAKFLGSHPGEVQSVWDGFIQLWPVFVGLGADAGSLLTTIKSSKVNKSFWKQKTFWLQFTSGLMVMVGAFGIDLSGAQPLVTKVIDSSEAIVALIGSALVIIGRFRLRQQ